MNKSRMVLAIALIVIAGLLNLGCPKPKAPNTPVIVAAPESTWINATTPIRVFTTAPNKKDVRFITDLGQPDGKIDTSDVAASGDTTFIYPKWTQTGTFNFRIAAYLDEDPTKVSEFSEAKSIRVLPNEPPGNLWVRVPPVVPKNVEQKFYVSAVDPEGDSIQFYFDFGDGSKGWVDTMLASGETLVYAHKYTREETVLVQVKARDWKRSESAPESVQVVITGVGRVIWHFVGPTEDSAPPLASPVVIDTMIYSYADDGYFYAIGYGSGRKQASYYSTRGETPDDYTFQGHPAYCAARMHIICGNNDGYVYALAAGNLNKAWDWRPDTMERGWGTPAINGDKIYIASDDDTLYYLQDAGSSANRLGAYKLPGSVAGAPVIDRSGYVIVALDIGILYRFEPNLQNPAWICTLRLNSELTSPVIGDDGTIYVGDDSGYVYAVNEAGSIKTGWPKAVDPAGISGMVIGTNALFVTTAAGKLVALNPQSGTEIYAKSDITTNEIIGSPVLTANGYIYFMDDDDILYAVEQSTGNLVWLAECRTQVEGRGRHSRPRRLEEATNPSLTLGPTGNIIVVGADYLYGVLGYPEGTLPNTPWPKWQKDLYNTGKK